MSGDNSSSSSDSKKSSKDCEDTLNCVSHYTEGEYAEASKLPFQDLLKIHHTQTVWGFKFGNEILASSLARDKNMKKSGDETPTNFTDSQEKTEISSEPGPSTTMTEKDHKTPHSRRRAGNSRTSKRRSSRQNDFVSPQKTRKAPLPIMHWADSKEVWSFMVYKEEASLNLRNPRLFEDFTSFMPRMRAILLDWVMEVCEVYHLRRVTYYLSVDYFDRFLSIRPDVPKNQLQLVGVTCLFLASKLEEVYPPRLTEFSYVCDGACNPDEILACELLILNSLGWDLNIMTPSDWLNLYMQIHFKASHVTRQKLHVDINREFFFPQYSGYQFTRASQLIDLFSLDPGFLKFGYSTIAAAAMYFMYGKTAALSASGLTWTQLQPCAEYMAVFYHVVRDSPDPRLQSCKGDANMDEQSQTSLASIRFKVKNLVKDENHSLQTHVVNMDYFERSAIIRLEQMGLKVQRTYVKKAKSNNKIKPMKEEEDEEIEKKEDDEDKDKENEGPKVNENENEEDFAMVCLYELEKTNCDAVALSDEEINITSTSSSDADIIMPDDSKALLSFDEILEGIVKCNKKNIPIQSPSSKELLSDESCID